MPPKKEKQSLLGSIGNQAINVIRRETVKHITAKLPSYLKKPLAKTKVGGTRRGARPGRTRAPGLATGGEIQPVINQGGTVNLYFTGGGRDPREANLNPFSSIDMSTAVAERARAPIPDASPFQNTVSDIAGIAGHATALGLISAAATGTTEGLGATILSNFGAGLIAGGGPLAIIGAVGAGGLIGSKLLSNYDFGPVGNKLGNLGTTVKNKFGSLFGGNRLGSAISPRPRVGRNEMASINPDNIEALPRSRTRGSGGAGGGGEEPSSIPMVRPLPIPSPMNPLYIPTGKNGPGSFGSSVYGKSSAGTSITGDIAASIFSSSSAEG